MEVKLKAQLKLQNIATNHNSALQDTGFRQIKDTMTEAISLAYSKGN